MRRPSKQHKISKWRLYCRSRFVTSHRSAQVSHPITCLLVGLTPRSDERYNHDRPCWVAQDEMHSCCQRDRGNSPRAKSHSSNSVCNPCAGCFGLDGLGRLAVTSGAHRRRRSLTSASWGNVLQAREDHARVLSRRVCLRDCRFGSFLFRNCIRQGY